MYIPVSELGEELKVQKWKLVTEYSGEEVVGIGDFVPDEGTVELWSTIKEALLTIIVPSSVESVSIDGVSYTPVNGTVSVYVTVGEHRIVVPSEVEAGPEVKMVFEEWSDGVENVKRVIYVAEDGAVLEALYTTYYKVSVFSPVGKACCSGWYREGSTVNIFLTQTEIVKDSGVRAVFEGWSGYWGENSFFENNPSQVVPFLRDPINISAVWRTEYYLDIVSKYGAPSGEGWYLAGSQARVEVDSELIFENGIKVVFKRWIGDVESSQTSLTLIMDAPKILEAEWLTLYRFTITFLDTDGNPINPDYVEVAGPSGPYGCKPVESSCVFWLEEGDYKVSRINYMGVNLAEDIEISVSKPSSIEVSLPIYDVAIKVEDFFGRPMADVEVELTLASGEKITGRTDSAGVAHFEDVPAGRYRVTTRNLAVTSSGEITVDENVEVELSGNLGWETGILFSAIVISLTGFAIYKSGLLFGTKVAVSLPCSDIGEKLEDIKKNYEENKAKLDKRY